MYNNFSVVICTYNRRLYIEKCLEKILQNNILPKKIIIVDTNPSISTNTQPQSTQPLNSDPFVHNQATAPTYSSSPEYESFSNFVK